ncbi:PEP-CTERM sorting domain-containing protein [Aquabacterium sp. A7-Y]|uniref:PEP-CTERM sorting domain-containing protein n=1 Tax=Aquabacterium sp. A7-Y TaxID=1349605 RepID=UPI00223E48FA|nr:PEP-CTERM sorting domain-containing protein [Aquabacterium sp. A7-Y]MCW7539772.1 PEP-CTERM sorting domain-containing protein [Aquabacterium sp. A7-Y]
MTPGIGSSYRADAVARLKAEYEAKEQPPAGSHLFTKRGSVILIKPIAAALAALCIAAPAAAGFTAHGSVTQLQFAVTDLAPDDGLDAFYTLGFGSSSYFALGSESLQFDGPVFLPEKTFETPGAMLLSGPSQLMASVTQSDSTGIRLHTYAHTSTFLTLAPNSSFTFSGVVSADMSCVVPCAGGFAIARAALRTVVPDSGNSDRTVAAYAAAGSAPAEARTFSLTYENHSSRPVELTISMSADAYASGALPVPEPTTYALLAAGLGVVGFVARRRGRHKDRASASATASAS